MSHETDDWIPVVSRKHQKQDRKEAKIQPTSYCISIGVGPHGKPEISTYSFEGYNAHKEGSFPDSETMIKTVEDLTQLVGPKK